MDFNLTFYKIFNFYKIFICEILYFLILNNTINNKHIVILFYVIFHYKIFFYATIYE